MSRAELWVFGVPLVVGGLLLVGTLVVLAPSGVPLAINLLLMLPGLALGAAVAYLATLSCGYGRFVAGLLLLAWVLVPVGGIVLAVLVDLPVWWLPNTRTTFGAFAWGLWFGAGEMAFQRFLRLSRDLRARREPR